MADANQDPTYLAYLRALGFDSANEQTDASLATEKAQAMHDVQLPEIDYQGEVARRNINTAAEDRGMFRSSGALQDLADQRHQQGYQTGMLELGLGTSVGDIQQKLAAQLAANQTKLGDQELLGFGRQYLEEGLDPYKRGKVG